MATILVVDDHRHKRKSVVNALTTHYNVATTDQPELLSAMIDKLNPALILINQLSDSFNPASLFFSIKALYPKMPVLFYVLRYPDAISTFKQTISMALGEKSQFLP